MLRNVYDQGERMYMGGNHYSEVKNPEEWEICPNCNLKPLIWEFDNGRFTACCCGTDDYSHHTVCAESIISVINRSHNGTSALEHDSDELRKNWNHWCKTGEHLFIKQYKIDGKW